MKAIKRKPHRSGPTIPESERAARGLVRVQLRLPRHTATLLAIHAKDAGISRAAYIQDLIERADLEHAERAAAATLT